MNVAAGQSPTIDAEAIVNGIIARAVDVRASDVHIEPGADGWEIRLRVDGLLETISRHDAVGGRMIVMRLMVMAKLLTYRMDIPQEGRVSMTVNIDEKPTPIDLRLAIMPTTHGPRAALRLPAELIQPRTLAELELPTSVLDCLHDFAHADAGLLLLAGPAGSGKTTTIYALLQHIAAMSPGLSLIALEDPVERDLPGVTQIEVQPFGQLSYERALRSILRQDPQVLMIGEIRDPATASLALQAALSGHRLISTLHAASPAGAVARLLEMGLEPYLAASALWGVVAQRLLRRKSAGDGSYRGRIPAAECMRIDKPIRQAILRRADAAELMQLMRLQAGHQSLRNVAGDLVARGITDIDEQDRVFSGDAENS